MVLFHSFELLIRFHCRMSVSVDEKMSGNDVRDVLGVSKIAPLATRLRKRRDLAADFPYTATQGVSLTTDQCSYG